MTGSARRGIERLLQETVEAAVDVLEAVRDVRRHVAAFIATTTRCFEE